MSSQEAIAQGEEADDAQPSGEPQLSRDTIFFALSNQRRRHVLHYLKRCDGPARLRDLTEQIAAWENGLTVEDVRYKQRKTVYTSLRQTHLPMLEKEGIVESDESGDHITLAARADDLDRYLDLRPAERFPWAVYYAGLGAVGLGVGLLALAGVLPAAALPPAAPAVVLGAVLLGSAAVQLYRRRMRSSWQDPARDR